jgi:hypothetical protein
VVQGESVTDLSLGPLRETDFPDRQKACLTWTDKVLARTRLPAKCAEVFAWGIEINQAKADRPWAGDSKKIERCHLLDKVELDPESGIYALCSGRRSGNEPPANAWIGICSWSYLPAAALHLRARYSAAIGNKFASFERHLLATITALDLQERPINDQRLPSYAQARNGTLFRFDSQTAGKVCDYFILAKSENREFVSAPLDDSCHLVCAYSGDSNEPLRSILTVDSWSAAQAEKELRRWLRTHPHKAIGTL